MLTDDRDHPEDVKAQRNVACDLHLRKRGLTVDALGEDAPGDFLGNGCLGRFLAERLVEELPRFFSATKIPATTALPEMMICGAGSRLCGDGAICEWKSTQKPIQNGKVHSSRVMMPGLSTASRSAAGDASAR